MTNDLFNPEAFEQIPGQLAMDSTHTNEEDTMSATTTSGYVFDDCHDQIATGDVVIARFRGQSSARFEILEPTGTGMFNVRRPDGTISPMRPSTILSGAERIEHPTPYPYELRRHCHVVGRDGNKFHLVPRGASESLCGRSVGMFNATLAAGYEQQIRDGGGTCGRCEANAVAGRSLTVAEIRAAKDANPSNPHAAAKALADARDAWQPIFSPWRHGGWYVDNVRYPSGAVGCVSRNYADRKWRIVCDPREGSYPGGPNDHTYANRDAAARAERELVRAISAETP